MYTIYCIYTVLPYSYQPTGVWNTAPMDSYHDHQGTWIDPPTHVVHNHMILYAMCYQATICLCLYYFIITNNHHISMCKGVSA